MVCTATTSTVPVFRGADLSPGTHVSGVGSFTPGMREVDAQTVAGARVFVESIACAGTEAGELLDAERHGATDRRDWTEIGAVLNGDAPGRKSADEITFYKSVGHAFLDALASDQIWSAARAQGLGQKVKL